MQQTVHQEGHPERTNHAYRRVNVQQTVHQEGHPERTNHAYRRVNVQQTVNHIETKDTGRSAGEYVPDSPVPQRHFGRVIGFSLGLMLCAGIFLAGLGGFLSILRERDRAQALAQKMKQTAQLPAAREETEASENTGETEGETSAALSDELSDPYLQAAYDFEKLWKMNPEIIGWLCIPGTVIDYPVCQGSSNATYLYKSAEGKSSSSGAIFMDAADTTEEGNLILYGHNMRLGHMFGSLKKYRDISYYKEHPCIYLYLPGETRKYEIYSVHTCAAGGTEYRTDLMPSTESYSQWKALMQQRSAYQTTLYRNRTEQMLAGQTITLSTCVSGGDASLRLVVQAELQTSWQQSC